MDVTSSRLRRPSALALPAFASAVGFLIGARRLSDNSFLTHLATGRLILADGFPHHDPYTSTATGEPWVVQSWLASVLYGLAEELADLDGVRVLTALLAAGMALVCWRLTAPAGGPIARLLVWVPAVLVGTRFWVERPLLVGLVLLGCALVAAEGGIDRRWLLPIGWIWVNTHGSWPLGLVALVAIAAGRRLDGDGTGDVTTALRWLVGGVVLGGLNPYGPRLLAFPVELLSRRDSLQLVAEWQAPRFASAGELAFLLLLAVAVVGLRRRPSWAAALPLVLFSVAALVGARNIPVAVVVLLPGTARALHGLGGMAAGLVGRQGRLVAVAALALAAVAVARIGSSDPFDGRSYPIEATDFLVTEGLAPMQVAVVAEDDTGNYFEARFGPGARAFIDDRVEVIPEAVIDDYLVLVRGGHGWHEVLERYEAEVVLWDVDRPLTELLRLDDGWELVHEDEEYAVFRTRASTSDRTSRD